MKKILALLIGIIALSGTICAQENQSLNIIEVSATANKSVTPDEIYLNITINEKDNKGKISVDQQEEQMVKALEGLGIKTKEQLTVKNMGSTLQNHTLKKDEIFASKEYSLKLTSASDAYAAINALNLEIEVKDTLLAEAARKAKENASIMAKAVGSKAGKALFLSNTYYFSQEAEIAIPFALASRKANTDNSAYKSEIKINNQTISMSIKCKFELVQ